MAHQSIMIRLFLLLRIARSIDPARGRFFNTIGAVVGNVVGLRGMFAGTAGKDTGRINFSFVRLHLK